MSREDVAAVARALLYEGYMLYPYRPSSVKNRQRFNFGVIYPERHGRGQDAVDPWLMQTECLVLGDAGHVGVSDGREEHLAAARQFQCAQQQVKPAAHGVAGER